MQPTPSPSQDEVKNSSKKRKSLGTQFCGAAVQFLMWLGYMVSVVLLVLKYVEIEDYWHLVLTLVILYFSSLVTLVESIYRYF